MVLQSTISLEKTAYKKLRKFESLPYSLRVLFSTVVDVIWFVTDGYSSPLDLI